MTQYISIKDASDLSGKSVQTIRRMIKSKKIKYRKDRTPQGFNYLIDLISLKETCNIQGSIADIALVAEPAQATQKVSAVDLDIQEVAPQNTQQTETAQTKPVEQPKAETITDIIAQDRSHQQIVSYEPVKEFTDTIQQLVVQHGKEKENLFRLIETFQNKVISLENKLKVESNAKKSFFKFW